MKTIKTTAGQTLYVGWTVPQVDGGVRYLCGATERDAREIYDLIRRDPAMIDGCGAIPVNGRR